MKELNDVLDHISNLQVQNKNKEYYNVFHSLEINCSGLRSIYFYKFIRFIYKIFCFMFLIRKIHYIIIVLLIISCSKKNTNSTIAPLAPPSIIAPLASPPINLNAKVGFRLDTLSWTNNNTSAVKGYNVYRDTIPNPVKFLLHTSNTTIIDTGLLLNRKYYYNISTFNKDSIESKKSNDLSLTSINANTNIGGALFVGHFGFVNATAHKIQVTLTFNNMPTNWDGTPTKDGWYLTTSCGSNINDTVGYYFGLQTCIIDNMHTPPYNQPGFIFSQWGSNDVSRCIAPLGGYAQYGNTEGAFVTVRKNYKWGKGTYVFTFGVDSTTHKGDWYSVWLLSKTDNINTYMGSICFPFSSKKSGINPGGGMFLEHYYIQDATRPLPNWNITINQILADGYPLKTADCEYGIDNTGSLTVPSNISYKNSEIHIDMGYYALRLNNQGILY